MRTYDYVVANPPFSDKSWSTGVSLEKFQRFEWGTPPAKQGDYAYLLHIIRSMKGTGKAACILPHGVLFRGNAEAGIRRRLIESGILKGIIGLPANLFYGTGIPACILVLDKENATARKGIFMVDASQGFMKDGNKNRLRSRDIHRIVDVFTHFEEHPGFSRLVPLDEIADARNDYNLNLPRYIDTREAEDLQDIEAHLQGGIPNRDIEALSDYWEACPKLRSALFTKWRPGYQRLKVDKAELKSVIHQHPEFSAFLDRLQDYYTEWRAVAVKLLRQLEVDCQPKEVIHELSESLLAHYEQSEAGALLDAYAVYQHLMDYWAETMQDDAYLISADGWVARTYRKLEANEKTKKSKDKGWACDLVPKELVVSRYLAEMEAAVLDSQSELESLMAELTELEEEHGGEEGPFAELEKINKGEVSRRLKEIRNDPEEKEAVKILKRWIALEKEISELKKSIKAAEAELDASAYQKYPELSESDVQALVVEDKWLSALESSIQGEMDRISQRLIQRIQELADRYDATLAEVNTQVSTLETKVQGHLERMGVVWE